MTTSTAPWPIVGECHYPAPSMVARDHSCPQCDGSHDHEWVTWRNPDASVLGVSTNDALPVRCSACGARKCDLANCMARRHHRGPHEPF